MSAPSPAAASSLPFPRQPAPAPGRPSSEGKPAGTAPAPALDGVSTGEELRQQVHSAGAGPATASAADQADSVAATARDGEPPAASTTAKPQHTTLDIEALIALATSHSPPPGYVQPNRSGTPAFVYGQGSGYPHASHGGGQSGDSRVALFVGNLPFRVRWQDLKDLMRRAGTVLRADVALGPDNRSKGHGMVLMGSRDDGMRAIEMFHGYNWQTRILEVRPERLPPEYEQHASPMQHGMRSGASPSVHFQQPQGAHAVANMFLNHSHNGQMNGLSVASNGLRSASPYNSNNGGGRSPFMPGSGSPALQSASPSGATSQAAGMLGLGPVSTSSPSVPSPSLSAALLNHNQQQIVRALTPKASAAAPSSLGPQQTDVAALETALAANLRLSASPQLPAAPSPGSRAPPPGSLGSLPPPPAFGQVGHGMQPAYTNVRQTDGRSSSRTTDNLAGRVLFVGNLPFHIQWQDLKDLFRTAGNIQRANVALGGDGRSRGFGSVQYSTREDAQIAIGLFDGYELNGRKLQVHHESTDVSRSGGPPPPGPYHPPPMSNQQQQQALLQQRAQQQQQMSQLQMNFGRPPPDAGYYVPASPFHGPPSPFHPPQSPGTYGPPSSFPYFPPTFAAPQSFGSAYSGAQAPSNGLVSTTEENSRRESLSSGSTAGSAEPMPSPIGPPRGHPPGRISLPPAYPFNNGPPSAGSAMSPMHGRGLPMLTPSMPSFQFHNGFPQTPPLFPQFLSPGLGPMSPPLHSPPYFHPYLNAAPGAPMFHPQDNPMFPPSAVYQQAPPPALDGVAANGEQDEDQSSAQPLGAPVFASLSRDGSVTRSSDGGQEHSGEESEEPVKTPTLASSTLPSTPTENGQKGEGKAD